jgi:serine/threonine protein kinase
VILVQEYAAGGDLASIAAKHPDGRPRESQIVQFVLRPILSALTALHARGIVHRDIKPANICYNVDSQLRLVDFGWAIDTTKEQPNTKAGTPVSSEQGNTLQSLLSCRRNRGFVVAD